MGALALSHLAPALSSVRNSRDAGSAVDEH
jgi:hypothetical protein